MFTLREHDKLMNRARVIKQSRVMLIDSQFANCESRISISFEYEKA